MNLVVVEIEQELTEQDRAVLYGQVEMLAKEGQRVLVLPLGARLASQPPSPALDRIEQKLDLFLAAMNEYDGEEPTYDLEGNAPVNLS